MQINIDVDSIDIQVRCYQCDAVMHIFEKYEFQDYLTVEVDTCEECHGKGEEHEG